MLERFRETANKFFRAESEKTEKKSLANMLGKELATIEEFMPLLPEKDKDRKIEIPAFDHAKNLMTAEAIRGYAMTDFVFSGHRDQAYGQMMNALSIILQVLENHVSGQGSQWAEVEKIRKNLLDSSSRAKASETLALVRKAMEDINSIDRTASFRQEAQ